MPWCYACQSCFDDLNKDEIGWCEVDDDIDDFCDWCHESAEYEVYWGLDLENAKWNGEHLYTIDDLKEEMEE